MHTAARLSWPSGLLLATLAAAGSVLAAPASGGDDTVHERKAKQALDDRADPRMRSDDVGKGTHFARKPTLPGAYFGDAAREAVYKYYSAHPAPAGRSIGWQVGAPLPGDAAVTPVPGALLGSLPKVPPGLRYVQVAGDILLVASGSRMVVDGIDVRPR
jgi:hypothetical protein